MEDLKALINVVNRQKIKQIDIISNEANLNSKTRELYDGISEGIIETDELAAKMLYGSHKKDPNYVKLKYRLKQKLYNTLFFIDTNKSNYSDQRRAFYKASKDWICMRMLLNQLSRTVAINLAENAIKNSLKFDFTDISLLLARELKMHYGYISPNKKKFKRYSDLVDHLLFTLECELKAEGYYTLISNQYAVSKSSKTEKLIPIITEYCKDLEQYIDKVDSFTFRYLSYSLFSFKNILQKDYERTIDLITRALQFFRSKPYNSRLTEYSFRNDLIFSYLNIGEYSEALVYIMKNREFVIPGTHNWLRVLNFHFIQSILSKNYAESYEIVDEVISNPKSRKNETHYQPWLVKEAYVNLLMEIGKISKDIKHKKSKRTFRLNRFLNDVPLYSKDKRGLNISILIAQVLYLILSKKFDEVLNRIDALNQYCYRYLRNDDTLRSNCFIKMLIKLPDADYHPIRIQRYVKKFLDKLRTTPLEITEQSIEIEVIPYEALWEIVLELLESIKK